MAWSQRQACFRPWLSLGFGVHGDVDETTPDRNAHDLNRMTSDVKYMIAQISSGMIRIFDRDVLAAQGLMKGF